jgi:hypothetical protein
MCGSRTTTLNWSCCAGSRWFANLPMPVLDGLGARLTPAAFEAGELIMSEGDQGDRYVLIVDGTVTFTQHGAVVNVLHTGSAFGESCSCATSPERPQRRQPRRSRRGPSTARHSLPHWGAIHMPEPQPKRWPTSTSREHPPLTVAELRDSCRTPDIRALAMWSATLASIT